MLRVVLDANVYISALIKPSGPPGQILKLFLENRSFDLILSKTIVEEIRRSLYYSKVSKYLSFPKSEIELWLACLELLSEMVKEEIFLDIQIEDKDDAKYIAAGVESKANYIISGDHHLLDLKEFEGIKIITPKVFLDILLND